MLHIYHFDLIYWKVTVKQKKRKRKQERERERARERMQELEVAHVQCVYTYVMQLYVKQHHLITYATFTRTFALSKKGKA
jgi:hypothetical protein